MKKQSRVMNNILKFVQTFGRLQIDFNERVEGDIIIWGKIESSKALVYST